MTIEEIDKEIEVLMGDFSNGKWLLDEQAIGPRQGQIRKLRFQKQTLIEEKLSQEGTAEERARFGPLVLRRKFMGTVAVRKLPQKDSGSIFLNNDGEQFKFTAEDTFKHSKGNWNCKACNPPGAQIIKWCPKFLDNIASIGPERYAEMFKKNNPDAIVCYAGLLHVQFTKTDTHAEFIKMCDTCGWSEKEVKELVKEFDPNTFQVSTELGNKESTTLIVNCTECGEVMVEIPLSALPPGWTEQDKLPAYWDSQIEIHWRSKHTSSQLKLEAQ